VIKEKDYLSRIKDVELFACTVKALKLLRKSGFKLILVSNQSGIGRGYFTENKLKKIHNYLQKLLKKKGAGFDAMYYCPHAPDAGCSCRKPNLGLVKLARKKFKIDLKKSYSIGDHKGDFLLGRNMGGKGVFVLTGHGRHEYAKFMKDPSAPRPDRIESNIYKAAKWILADSMGNDLKNE
jgi:histidinol-phosphate phosphatase family protein